MASILVVGLMSLFVALHIVSLLPATRARLVGAVGETAYKLAYTACSVVGLIGAFYIAGQMPPVAFWSPPELFGWVSLAATLAAFMLIGAAYVGGNGQRFARHPMLAGVALWAGAHVLTNGDVGHLVVFGALAAYALLAMQLSDRRDARRDPEGFARTRATTSLVPFTRLGGEAVPWRGPLAGLVSWVVLLVLHPWLFGVSPVPV